MSLYFYLETPATPDGPKCPHCGRFDAGRDGEEVFSANITHNLAGMAKEAGIYDALWHPENIPANTAGELIHRLEAGLELLKSDQPRYEKLNSPNGWGTYANFFPFVERCLAACKEHPTALVRTST